MVSVQKVVIDANKLVFDLYPDVRERLKQEIPFLDEHVGNRLADQSLFLERQLGPVDVDLGKGRAYYFQILVKAQELALEAVRKFELESNFEITGQTP